MDTYTTSQITKILDIPFGRLREWIVKGYIEPTIPSPGQGRPAEFSLDYLYNIEAFRRMIDGGLSRETAADYLHSLDPGFLTVISTILFRRSKGQIYVSINAGEGERPKDTISVLSLHTGRRGILLWQKPKWVLIAPEEPSEEFTDDWDDIYILNGRNICKFVDERISKFLKA